MTETETPAGIFTINRYELPGKYTPAQKQRIEHISDSHIRIVTMDQEVEVEGQILSPSVYQSCMEPDKITVYPLEIECIGEKMIFRDHYHTQEWSRSQPPVQIRSWYPHLKKGGCFPCTNCGRC